jgi:outer membrane phospholipase A
MRHLQSLSILLLIVALGSMRAAAQENWTHNVPFEAYKPNYALEGQPDMKIQGSLKVPLITDQNLYFGYTQLIIWQALRPDPYISDINYDPELFYRVHIKDQKTQWLDLGLFEHESNGKGGAEEVSWNRSYVRYHAEWFIGAHAKIRAEVKAWVPYDMNANNRDLPEYRGLWESSVMLSDFRRDSVVVDDLIFRFYAGGPSNVDPARGGQEFTWRVKSSRRKYVQVVMFQVFHGVAESLLDYKHSLWAWRAGIGF